MMSPLEAFLDPLIPLIFEECAGRRIKVGVMAKRIATTQINQDNWDDPVEEEKAGTFSVASEDALQKRVLKTAKRRIKPGVNSEGNKPIFASFTGFKPSDTLSNSTGIGEAKPFGFLADLKSSGASNGSTAVMGTKSDVSPQEKYLAELKELNCSVSNWIKTHVDADPVCILTPVFADYDKFLKKIQNERDTSKTTGEVAMPTVDQAVSFSFSSNSAENKFKMTAPTTESSTSVVTSSISGLTKNTGKSPLSFTEEDKAKTPSLFSSFKSDTPVSSVFTKPDPSSLMINPFISVLNKPAEKASSDSSAITPDNKEKEKEEDEESDEPLKVEFTPIQEEGSVYSTRCKVFVKKGNNYADRGLGTLFVKKVGEEKHQLLIRAETVLGNILVNVLLSSGVPLQRMGKNNVMLVCLPTPQDPPPPTTVLLRVKTTDEADKLLATLQKYKN